MNTNDLDRAAISLRKGQLHRIHDGAGQRIEALSGALWVTIDHDLRDIVVTPGEGFSIDRDGDTIVSALDDARFALLDPVVLRRTA
ncbi:MAG TPA: DUF2917 domain-containing protein [Burkholderiaceae bacterium]|nr:DUF2917 domain-containing protein [Burkholderiaceae bacterium]